MFIYLQVICFDSRVVKQHSGSSVSWSHAESFHHTQYKLFGSLEFFFAQGFRTIQQERQIHGAVTSSLRHQSGEGQGREGAVGRCRCGSGERGEGGTNFAAQSVVVTVASEEKNKKHLYIRKEARRKCKISRLEAQLEYYHILQCSGSSWFRMTLLPWEILWPSWIHTWHWEGSTQRMATSSSSWPAKKQKLNSHTLFVVWKRMFTILFILSFAFESVSIFGTWGAVGMASFYTWERTVEGIWVLAGDRTGWATSIIPPLA